MHVRLQSQLYNYNDLQVVCSIGQAVCTRADSGHGVVQVRIDDEQLRGLYCCTCKYNKQHCSHVDIVEKALNSPDEDKHDCLNKIAKDLSSVQQNRQVHVHQYRSLSSSSIPFNLSSELSQQLACTVADRFNIVNNTSILGSVDTYCKECSTLTRDEEDKQESVRAKLYCSIQLSMRMVGGFRSINP